MKIKDIVNELFERCLFTEINGYDYEPTVFDGIYFDTYLLNKYEHTILNLRKKVEGFAKYKGNPIYEEEIGDAENKIACMLNALELSEDVDLGDKSLATKYKVTEDINRLLSYFGYKFRVSELSDEYAELYENGILKCEGRVTKDDKFFTFDFRENGFKLTIEYGIGEEAKNRITIKEATRETTRVLSKDSEKTTVKISSSDNNIQTRNAIDINNNNKTFIINRSDWDKISKNEIANNEIYFIQDTEIGKREEIYVDEENNPVPKSKNAKQIATDLLLTTAHLYINKKPVVPVVNEELKQQIYDEIISHEDIKMPIESIFGKFEAAMPGIIEYLFERSKFVLEELNKDTSASEVIEDIMKHTKNNIYNDYVTGQASMNKM